MSTALAIFVKTPGLTPLKTRLAVTVGKERAEEFYVLSLNALKETILSINNITPYFAVAETGGLNNELWTPFNTFQASGVDLGEVLHNAYEHLIKTHDYVIFLGSDSPQITREMIDTSLTLLKSNEFVFGPACDGGFYLFAGKKNIPKNTWCDVTYSCDTTLNELSKNLSKIGSISHLPQKLSDVDEEHHLQDIINEMPHIKTKSQQKIINWVKS